MKNKKFVISLIVIILLIYLGGVQLFNDKFLPGTYINEAKVSGLNPTKINKKLEIENKWEDTVIAVDGNNLFSINREDINYEYFNNNELTNVINKQNNWLWFVGMFKKEKYSIDGIFLFNYDKIKSIVRDYKPFYNELTNAHLVYSNDTQQFEIAPHLYSMSASEESISRIIIDKIKDKENKVDLSEFAIRPEIVSTNENLVSSKNQANKYLSVILTYDFGNNQEVVNKDLIKDWITFNGEEIVFDKELIREYVINTLSAKYDTYGKPREFITTSGNTITTNGGAYGWLIHRANTVDDLLEHLLAMEDKTIEPIYSYTAVSRNANDLGNSYVEIDIQNQMVYVYEKGKLKVSTPTVTGNLAKGHATPLGVDPLNYKRTNVVLRGPGYASPVKYWMPFNGGVGLHDADWRGSFGGNIYKTNGSHGCINLPPAIAVEVFNLVFPGMPVIVY